MWHKIKNFFYWGWKLRDDFDWDSGYLYRIMLIKSEKMLKYFQTPNEYYDLRDNRGDYRRLVEFVGLLKPITDEPIGRHYERVYNKHGSGLRINGLRLKRERNVKHIDDKLHRFMIKKAFEKDSAEKQRIMSRMCWILEKHSSKWWD